MFPALIPTDSLHVGDDDSSAAIFRGLRSDGPCDDHKGGSADGRQRLDEVCYDVCSGGGEGGRPGRGEGGAGMEGREGRERGHSSPSLHASEGLTRRERLHACKRGKKKSRTGRVREACRVELGEEHQRFFAFAAAGWWGLDESRAARRGGVGVQRLCGRLLQRLTCRKRGILRSSPSSAASGWVPGPAAPTPWDRFSSATGSTSDRRLT